MMTKSLSLFAGLLGLGLPLLAAAEVRYQVIPLGGPEGWDPVGINNAGQVAGGYMGTSGPHGEAPDDFAVFAGKSAPGAAELLESLGTGARFVAINNAGVAAGSWFLWDGRSRTIPPLAKFSAIAGINDANDVVGQSEGHAFVYRDGAVADLGTLGGAYSGALAINNAGQIVGWSDATAGGSHAFLHQSGVMTDLGTFGGSESRATDINDSGAVVGTAQNSSQQNRAFLYQDGVMKDLGTLGGAESGASAINARGDVVGWTSGAVISNLPFLYEGGVMKNLNRLISPTCGFQFTSAVDINDSGAILVGGIVHTRGKGTITGVVCVLKPLTPRVPAPVLSVSGGRRLIARSARFQITGKTRGAVNNVTYRMKSGGNYLQATGTRAWSISGGIQLSKPVNVTIVAHGPGGDSKPVTVRVVRK